jgi:hypothetical protein
MSGAARCSAAAKRRGCASAPRCASRSRASPRRSTTPAAGSAWPGWPPCPFSAASCCLGRVAGVLGLAQLQLRAFQLLDDFADPGAASLPSPDCMSMLRSRNSFTRASASSSLASYCLICSFRKVLAESVSLRLAPRLDSTKIDTSDWITRLALSWSLSLKASVYRLSRPVFLIWMSLVSLRSARPARLGLAFRSSRPCGPASRGWAG